MCGIGVYASKNSVLEIQSMKPFMDCIIHRGPDNQSITQIDNNLIFANNRLSIIDGIERSNQPFCYKNYTITFNGAIYNFIEIKQELIELGHTFITESDTEVILHAYEEYGPKCLDKFNGMWAFAIYDSDSNTLFAARDRYAIKPLYYYHSKTEFLIASELKQFKHIDLVSLSYNKKRIVEYLNNGGFKNFDYKTFYNEVFQLEGGTYMLFDVNAFSKKLYRYYNIEDSTTSGVKDYDSLQELMANSIEKRLRADMNPGVLLSGGVDSSILTIGALQHTTNISSYSFIESRDSSMDESPFISDFLQKYPHKNNQVSLPEQMKKLIDECIYYQDEPPASLSVVAQFILYKLASYNKEKLTLSGQGADEIFGGYPRFFSYIPKSKMLLNLGNAIEQFRILLKNKKKATEPIFVFKDDSTDKVFSSKSYTKYLLFNKGLRDLLHYEDRNSMAHSVESRLPYLDFRLVEGMYNSKNSFKFKLARLKGALYQTFKQELPSSIFNRMNKLAFDTPEEILLKNDFFNFDEELGKLKSKFPDLPWNKKFKSSTVGEFTAWQVYFLNRFFEIDRI